MQPVDPRTIVRGPAALTISFITSADSHPWHVRWPEEKYSSIVTFLTPLKGSRTWVALVNVVVSAMACLLYLSPGAGARAVAAPAFAGSSRSPTFGTPSPPL